jgi:hypothetical protein
LIKERETLTARRVDAELVAEAPLLAFVAVGAGAAVGSQRTSRRARARAARR